MMNEATKIDKEEDKEEDEEEQQEDKTKRRKRQRWSKTEVAETQKYFKEYLKTGTNRKIL